ncbi:hypothetical protein IE81DRAFT_345738 [Ceraceosorus guamensis]|uniref:Zn(2)-C6 fungal-type domain-containing protein n=1 Tax=Ceraceosorus guamensis TaxID=1522189 RepID=A0A316W322_9BASI|nr:hypothetical protein IE81DRAFT_345738 [Ceraceosorus guamensis]PWN44266.1 hypothetical protein IE81DRAFT_345738 [Ceraceosorus guamensis]
MSDRASSTSSEDHHDHNGHDHSAHEPSSRGPPRKRNRAALSCTLCRERKVKCDRVIPCTQCIKRGDQAFCHLDPNKTGPAPKQPSKSAAESQAQHAAAKTNHAHPLSDEYGHHSRDAPVHPINQAQVSWESAEVSAIKARLAQLEAALQASTAASGRVMPDLAPSQPSQASVSQSLAQMYGPSTYESTKSVSSHGAAPSRSTSSANLFDSTSASAAAFGASSTSTSHSLPDGIRLPSLQTGSSNSPTSAFDARFDRSNSLTSSFSRADDRNSVSAPQRPSAAPETPGAAHRAEVDSDTEDAALVLEGLAMGSRPRDGKSTKASKLAKAGGLPAADRGDDDVIRRAPTKAIQDFVEADRTRNIMDTAEYQCTDEDKARAAEMAQKAATCRNTDEYYKDLPLDAYYGHDGKPLSPARVVCRMLSTHSDSLLRLISGPETALGWGIGWAFAAAEAAGDMKSVNEVKGCPGALQREAVLRAILRSLPSHEVANHLVNVFDERVKALAGHVIHMPSFRKEVAALYALDTVEKRARVIHIVDPGWLAQLLMVFVLALHFHPCDPERPEMVMHLFDGRTVHLWRSAAQTALVLARYQSSSSLSVLVAIILVNLHAAGTGRENFGLMHVAITNAREMGLHKLGSRDRSPKPGENVGVQIRRELAKRIWYCLCYKDWCSATFTGGAYTVHPDHFNTPPPSNYNDEDLCKSPLPPPHPPTKYTEMSFLLVQYKLMSLIREHIDLHNKREIQGTKGLSGDDIEYLDGRYRMLLADEVPGFFRVGSEEGAGSNMEVERFLLQQTVFHRLLRLHRPNLSRQSSRHSCVLLARSILDLQRRIRARCSVIDRLFLNLGQSFSAAIVLCLDLLQIRPTATMRTIVRSEIGEAVKALRHVASAHHTTSRSIRVIEALLDEEASRWEAGAGTDAASNKRKRDGEQGSGKNKQNLLSLALRVARAASGPEEDAEKFGTACTPVAATGADGSPTSSESQCAAKDARSRELMEQLMTAPPYRDEPSSFANFDAATLYGQTPGANLDFLSPADGQSDAFDISKFLADFGSPLSDGSGQASTNGNATNEPGGMSRNSSFLDHSSGSSSGGHAARGSFGEGSIEGHSRTASPQTSISDHSGYKNGANSNFPSHHAPSRQGSGEANKVTDALWAWMLAQGQQAVRPEPVQRPLGQPNWQPPLSAASQTQPPPASIAEWSGLDPWSSTNTSNAGAAALSAPSPASFASLIASATASAPQDVGSNLYQSAAAVEPPSTSQQTSLSVGTPSAGFPGFNSNLFSTPSNWEFNWLPSFTEQS